MKHHNPCQVPLSDYQMRRLNQMPFAGGKRPVYWDNGGIQRFLSQPWYDSLTENQRNLVEAALQAKPQKV